MNLKNNRYHPCCCCCCCCRCKSEWEPKSFGAMLERNKTLTWRKSLYIRDTKSTRPIPTILPCSSWTGQLFSTGKLVVTGDFEDGSKNSSAGEAVPQSALYGVTSLLPFAHFAKGTSGRVARFPSEILLGAFRNYCSCSPIKYFLSRSLGGVAALAPKRLLTANNPRLPNKFRNVAVFFFNCWWENR